ncbi:MAG: spore maturation protein [Clostridia bacterium]|nr:spore maturation protein [Clostridia bacterium]
MSFDIIIIPILLILLIVWASIKKINCYATFVLGAKRALTLCYDLFPYLIAIFFALELFRVSGLVDILSSFLSPVFKFFGIPKELSQLLLIRPFSGSGGLAALQELFRQYGADSYISRCGCVVVGSSETIFYVATVYFSQTKIKKLWYAIPLALVACFVGAIVGCLICKIM